MTPDFTEVGQVWKMTMPAFIWCMTLLGFDWRMVTEITGGNDKFVPAVYWDLGIGSHCTGFTHESAVNVPHAAILCGSVRGSELVQSATGLQPCFEVILFEFAVIGAEDPITESGLSLTSELPSSKGRESIGLCTEGDRPTKGQEVINYVQNIVVARTRNVIRMFHKVDMYDS